MVIDGYREEANSLANVDQDGQETERIYVESNKTLEGIVKQLIFS